MSNLKKLNNNFTTPEQGKKLMELGVPSDSADCALVRNLYFPIGEYEIKVLDGKYSRFIEMHDTWEILPCWSVGRIEEIIKITTCKGLQPNLTYPTYSEYADNAFDTYIDCLIYILKYYINLDIIKFSKLYEEQDGEKH